MKTLGMRTAVSVALLVATALPAVAEAQNPRVWLDTDAGSILLELDAERAPITSQNFLNYVNEGFYEGIVFHRVIDDFVIQGGGYDSELRFKQPIAEAIASERNNGLSNQPGSIAMALTSSSSGTNVDSATSQFFINNANNDFLDADFTVFGQVVAGLNTVDQISQLRTTTTFPDNSQLNRLLDSPIQLPTIRRAAEVAPDSFPLMPLHTGSWYDPERSGVGFNVEVTNDASNEVGPILNVYWYDFSQGRQIWLAGLAEFDWGASSVEVDLISVDQGFGDFLMPPSRDTFTAKGNVTIEFSGCSAGTVDYDLPELGSGQVAVIRLTTPVDASCAGLD